MQMSNDDGLVVRVQPAPEGDMEELADLTALLRADLLELDVDSVDPVPVEAAPEQAKGVAELVGWLAVRFGTVETLRAVVSAVRGWAARTSRVVEVSVGGDVLKLTGVTSEQQDRIIDGWLARHAAGA
jgi:hypothetical protein